MSAVEEDDFEAVSLLGVKIFEDSEGNFEIEGDFLSFLNHWLPGGLERGVEVVPPGDIEARADCE